MIKILSNVYLNTEFDILDSNLECNGIDIVIIFSDDKIFMYGKEEILSNVDYGLEVENIVQSYPINFDYINNMLINYLSFKKNLLIVSKNNLYGFCVICGFMMKYLNISLIDVLALSKFHKININNTLEFQELLGLNGSLKNKVKS